MKRSYGQWCALAKSLDVVGGRWTLLIMRELVGGPRRFRDLLDGLPGVGTNLLSERLTALQETGAIRKRTLPPPAGSSVYELTPRGRQLEPALHALASWGTQFLGGPDEGDEFRAYWLMIAVQVRFDPSAESFEGTCELRTSETDVAHFRVADTTMELFHGPADNPDVALRGEPKGLIGILYRQIPPDQALAAGEIELEGDIETLTAALEMFPAETSDTSTGARHLAPPRPSAGRR